MTKRLEDLTDEERKQMYDTVFANSMRNFLCMNSLHDCSVCGKKGLIHGQVLLILGIEPKCKGCIPKIENDNLDLLIKAIRPYWISNDDKRFVFEDGSIQDHMPNPDRNGKNGIGCQKCQPGMIDE